MICIVLQAKCENDRLNKFLDKCIIKFADIKQIMLSSLEDFFVYNWEFIILLFHTFSFTTTQIKYILQSQYKVIRIVVCTRDVNEMEALQQYNTWLLQYTEEIENFKIEVQFAQLGNFKHTASSISEIMKWSFANL